MAGSRAGCAGDRSAIDGSMSGDLEQSGEKSEGRTGMGVLPGVRAVVQA